MKKIKRPRIGKEKQKQGAAWSIHLYTATGGIIGVFALLAVFRGEIEQAFLLLMVSMLIDSTDGLMARKLKIWEVLPKFDGAMVDNVIDMLTFAWIPIVILGVEELVPNDIFLFIPIIGALYAYGQVNMKDPDGFFIGFPTYWNIIALYMYLLRPQPEIVVLVLLFFGILSFVPTRYLYPSKNNFLWKTTWALGAIWIAMIVHILTQEDVSRNFILLSLFYPIYYMVLSFYVEGKIRLTGKL